MVKQKVVIGVLRHGESKSGLLSWARSAPSQGFGRSLVQTHAGFCRFSVKRQVFG